ncbi:MAG TPA: PAS domain S-box protein [bacterium]|nr:PAS domain S-box protein [bacterium]
MSSKLKMILGSFLLFSLLLGGFVLFNLHRLEDDSSWLDRTHSTIHRLQRTYSDLTEAQANYLSYLLTHQTRYKETCLSQLQALRKDLDRTERTPPEEPLLGKEMGRWETLIGQKLDSIQDGLDDVAAGRSDRALALLQERSEKTRDQEIKSLTTQMIGTQIWFLKTRKAFEELNNRKELRFLAVGGVGVLLLFGLASFLIDRQMREKQALLASLRSSEEKFRFLSEAAHDAFLIADEKGHIIDLNLGAQELFGASESELLGLPISGILRASDAEAVGAIDGLLAETVGTRTLEMTGQKKDGTRFPLEGTVSHWTSQNGAYFTVVLRDITERKFFIKTLLANEHRLFQFLDAIPVAVLVREPNGGVYFVNRKAKELFRIGSEALPSTIRYPDLIRDLYQVGGAQPMPDQELPSSRALAGERTHRDDLELRRGNEVISLEVWGAPIVGEKGRIKFGLSALMDITQQKRSTESLREREEFFRNIFEEGPIGMILSLKDGTLVNANRAFADMLGIPKRDLLGHPFYRYTAPEDAGTEKALDEKLFDRLLPKYELEKRFVDLKGEVLWCKVSASTIRDPQDEPLFRLAIIENITEQKEAASALRESEERFRALAESANDGIISADAAGRIVFFNPSAERLLGYTSDEVRGKPIALLMSPASWEGNKELILRYFSTGDPTLPGRILELTGQRKDGSQFPAEISYFSSRTPGGLFFTSILRDITDRKQLEELKDDLISVVSHQLKTPVAQVNGFIENMLEGLTGEITPSQREYLTEMRSIGEENYRLISDLLSLSKIERGVLQADLQPEPIRQIVELTARDYADFIREKGLEFLFHGPDQDIRVLVDRNKTVEALRNILNNAFKWTDHGSISLSWGIEEGFGVVEIADTGVGMDDPTLKGLFNKSRVLGPEAGRSGAGLGLYIAKRFLDLQNAVISVSSERGKGSTFRIKLPLIRS